LFVIPSEAKESYPFGTEKVTRQVGIRLAPGRRSGQEGGFVAVAAGPLRMAR
jgi:hypothetical protein